MSSDIEKLRAVGRAATEGPWEWEADSCSDDGLTYTPSRVWTDGGSDHWGEANDDYVLAYNIGNEDAEFCATARNEWDALLDEVEAARAMRARVEALADVWERPGPKVGGTPEDAAWALREALGVDAARAAGGAA